MSADLLGLQIAASPVRDKIPKDQPLRERVLFAMRYVRSHEDELFWMTGRATDDIKFRTSLGAVMLAGNETDREIITNSMMPLKMLSAAASGVPVDFAALEEDDSRLPLLGMWHESKA